MNSADSPCLYYFFNQEKDQSANIISNRYFVSSERVMTQKNVVYYVIFHMCTFETNDFFVKKKLFLTIVRNYVTLQ